MNKQNDLRDRPSHWACCERLKAAADRGGSFPFVVLGALLALSFGRIANDGTYRFAWKQLKSFGLLGTLKCDFRWCDHSRLEK